VKAEPAEVEKKPEVEVESVEPTGRGSSGVFMSLNSEWFWQCCGSGSGGSRFGGSGIIGLLNPDLYKVAIIKDPPQKNFRKKLDIFILFLLIYYLFDNIFFSMATKMSR
jgi:hypothetical protein